MGLIIDNNKYLKIVGIDTVANMIICEIYRDHETRLKFDDKFDRKEHDIIEIDKDYYENFETVKGTLKDILLTNAYKYIKSVKYDKAKDLR